MEMEEIYTDWQEIDLDTFKKGIKQYEGQNVCIDIKTIVRTALTVENCQIIINKLNLIFSDENDLQVEIDIDPAPVFYTRGKYYYKIDLTEFHGEILLDFYK